MNTFTATIGLEVHVELSTNSKMFCGCKNAPHQGKPNANICPVCLAHPGTLPVPNEEAIAKVLLFGQAVGATVATYSEFDRKNYFYPDIPKAYQISQYAFPFLTGGSLLGVDITRVHLEEDTARNQHDKSEQSLVDYNRAGVPLMELVTEPVIHDSATAAEFARELQLVLQTLDIGYAQMERGEMRVEANISVSSDPTVLGTKVEVKNLNSFKSVEAAIDYEIARQSGLITEGEKVVQETRGWDEVKLKTFSQRSKETAKDYRYFPDPDIPSMDVSKHNLFNPSRIAEKMKELPEELRIKYHDIGLPIIQIDQLLADSYLRTFYSEVWLLTGGNPKRVELLKLASNYLLTDVVSLIKSGAVVVWSPRNCLELLELIVAGKITSRVAKDLLPEITQGNDLSALELVTARGLFSNNDAAALSTIVAEVIVHNASIVAEYKAGKVASLQFLIGQCMKATNGSANPAMIRELLEQELTS